MQLSELRECASRRDWIVTSEYVDHGVSGSKESRPQLNQLMADAHWRKFDAVLVGKIDRFGRSLKHLVPDYRRHGGVRAITHPGAGTRRLAKRQNEGQEVRTATRPG